MKNIEFGPSGWRSFLGRSLVGATALLAFTSVYAVNIDNFGDGFAEVNVTTLNASHCEHTLDSANGTDDMVGLDRDVYIEFSGFDGFGSGGVHAVVASNALTISADGGTIATAYVIWDSNGGDCAVNTSGINPAANMVINGETTVVVRARADITGSTLSITFYSSATNSSTYNFLINQANTLLTFEKRLNSPDSTTGSGANLTSVTAIRLDVNNFQKSLDIAFDLLATPVEVAGFDCNCSADGMVNYSWNTTLEEDIAGFLVGTCSDAGCTLLGEVAPQGTGFPYRASLAAAADGDCAMAVVGAFGLETDQNGKPVIYSGSCD